MKVLYITYDGITDPLGRSQILPVLKQLAQKGALINILSYEKESAKEKVKSLRDILTGRGINWRQLRYHKKPQVVSTFFDIITGLAYSLIIIIKTKLEIIHCRSYVACSIGFFLKLITKTKLLFDMRGYWADERVEGQIWRRGSAIYRIAKRMEKFFVENSDSIVVLTYKMKEALSREYALSKEKINVIPTCVDLDEFKIETRKIGSEVFFTKNVKADIAGKIIIVYSGSLGTVYMLDEMLDFYKVLKSNFVDLYFLFLINSKKDIVYNAVFKHGICHDDFSVVSVDYNSMNDWLNLSKLGIAFYKPDFSVVGRSPTKVGEYLACGLPSIINRGVGDIDEIIEREGVGIVVNSFNECGYKQVLPKISSLLSEPYLREKCRNVAKKYFDLEVVAQSYMSLYRNL